MLLYECSTPCPHLEQARSQLVRAAVPDSHLEGMVIWIGASRHDKASLHMKKLFSCLLNQLGAEVEDYDYQAVLKNRVRCDVLLMFTFTPGTSARAIELVVTAKHERSDLCDKLLVYMPEEYEKGYISRRLSQHIVAGKLSHDKKILYDKLNVGVFLKCVSNLIDIVNDKIEERKIVFKPEIAIVTALPHEFEAMKFFLSDRRLDIGFGDDKIQFPHGEIHGIPVVLAYSGAGNNLSSATATRLYERYSSIKHTFVVGIAGGIPNFDKPAEGVRLGDIVLSSEKGIIQYDMVKEHETGKEYNFSPRPPSATLVRNAKLFVEGLGGPSALKEEIVRVVSALGISEPKAARPEDSPWFAIAPDHALSSPYGEPGIFFGPIASANTVLKEEHIRNQLQHVFNAKAVEMESSGISEAAWLKGKNIFVVRGICDYANPAKNDEWQPYAAAIASAFVYRMIKDTLCG